MKIKVALIKSPATYANWYKQPVLGLSYLCSFLQKNGFNCKIFDAYYNSWTEKQLLDRILEFEPDYACFSAMTHEINTAANIAEQIKRTTKAITIIGGSHVTAIPEKTLSEFSSFDYGIFGEGENTLNELLSQLSGSSSYALRSIDGLCFKNEEDILRNNSREWLSSDDLDKLPFPAFEQYFGNDQFAFTNPNSHYIMFTSRGCPYNCSFCMQVLGHKVRRRSADNIVEEIKYAIDRYSAHKINFADEIFLFDNMKSKEILTKMIDAGLPSRIKWTGLTRANMVNSEIIKLAKEAGCCGLEMGVESGDDTILENTSKKITIEQIKNAVSIVKQANIPLGTYYILGHPGETRETIKKTVNLAVSLNTEAIAIGLMVPYPGTRIYDMAIKNEYGYKLISENWAHYDKYGGQALEIKDLPLKLLKRYQLYAIIYFYIKNYRYIELFSYVWQKRKALLYFIKKIFLKK